MRYVPHERRRKLYIALIRDGDIPLAELEKKFRLDGINRTAKTLSILRHVDGIKLEDGCVKLDYETCPQWVRYFLFIKEHGACDERTITEHFNKRRCNVMNVLLLHEQYLTKTSEHGRWIFELRDDIKGGR